MIGKALSAKLLDLGYDVIILTREKEKKSSREKLLYAFWNPLQEIIDQEALSKTDHLIHLAGAGIADKRWTKARKTEILKSRVDGGLFLAKTLKEFEELLGDYNFFRVHNSHLINLDYIKSYNKGKGGTVSMTDGSEIEVSTRRKDDFLKKLMS